MRDIKVDLLRVLGLSMIILAHSSPPSLLFAVRNFDVPLMVMVSGISFSLTQGREISYGKYIWSRFRRLVLPTWTFLFAFFASQAIVFPNSEYLNLNTIIESFSLSGGIGYVWIIKVFLIVALLTPLICKINNNIKSNIHIFIISIVLFLSNDIISMVGWIDLKSGTFISSILYYALPYSGIFLFGLRISRFSRKTLYISVVFFAIMLIASMLLIFIKNGELLPTQEFKYPPQAYYLSYSIFISIIMYTLIPNKIFSSTSSKWIKKLIIFISSNSMWIYLWHILFTLTIYEYFLIKFLLVSLFSIFVTTAQVTLVNYIVRILPLRKTHEKFVKSVLTG